MALSEKRGANHAIYSSLLGRVGIPYLGVPTKVLCLLTPFGGVRFAATGDDQIQWLGPIGRYACQPFPLRNAVEWVRCHEILYIPFAAFTVEEAVDRWFWHSRRWTSWWGWRGSGKEDEGKRGLLYAIPGGGWDARARSWQGVACPVLASQEWLLSLATRSASKPGNLRRDPACPRWQCLGTIHVSLYE